MYSFQHLNSSLNVIAAQLWPAAAWLGVEVADGLQPLAKLTGFLGWVTAGTA
jgi:hypothetical protein